METLQLVPRLCNSPCCGDDGLQIQMDDEAKLVDCVVVSSTGDCVRPRKIPRIWTSW